MFLNLQGFNIKGKFPTYFLVFSGEDSVLA